MSFASKHRYSFLITPLSYLLDLGFVTGFIFYYLHLDHAVWFSVYALSVWTVIALVTQYYILPRYITLNEVLSKFFRQIIIFDLALIAGLELFKLDFPNGWLLLRLALLDVVVLLKILGQFWLLKKYRSRGYNLRRYVIFGYNEELERFKQSLDQRVDYGYRFVAFFSGDKKANGRVKGDFRKGLEYIAENDADIDVIFASLHHTDEELLELIYFAEEHFKELKFVPDNREFFKNKLHLEYMETYPVLSLDKSPLDKPINAFIKRSFDIAFSLCVVLCLLSWLTPILAILIKLESRGPVFFKQKRNGEFYKPFYLYKFRSMRPNREADVKQVTKDDHRVTRIGRILRKTSIDELPQFFNVLVGDMSVVGPRPHMIKENEKFIQQVEKFLPRHQVKPGITGLAQVKGYRGEVKTKEDIEGRVKYDIHYIKNWSFLLDIKIILMTILNTLRGDRKAY